MDRDLTGDILEWVRNHYFGKYRGTVTDNSDPTNRGRLKVRIPSLLDTLEVWAMPCMPYAGADKGFFVIPEVGDGIWIEFEAGDPSCPIWSGSWWGDSEIPNDPSGSQGTTQTKILKSASGLIVDLDDNAGEIKVSDKSGSNIITIKVNEGKIVIQAMANVTVEAPFINLVENSTHPLVFGDNLLQYLNQLVLLYQSHVHPGEMAAGIIPVTPAPPVPPFPPATPALLSMKVTTG